MLDWGSNAITGSNQALAVTAPSILSQTGQNNFLNNGAGSLLGGMPGANPAGAQPLNWFQNLQNGFNESAFGSGLNSMAQGAGGWGNILGGASTIMQGLASWKASKLGRDQFNMSKNAFLDNYGAQQQMVENSNRDVWDARNAMAQANGQSGYDQSEQSFLDERGIANSRVG